MSGLDLIGARRSERLNPLRIAMKLRYLLTMSARMEAPTPRDLPQYRWYGKAHRVLLVGNGPTHGWGVLTHGHSLTGLLGSNLSTLSGKPVNVDYIGDELMNAQTALDWLADVDVSAYDAVVLLVGWNDAARLTPERIWEQSISTLLGDLRARLHAGAGLVVVGIEDMNYATGYRGWAAKVGQKHADKLNATLEAAVNGERETFLALSPREIEVDRPLGSPRTYQAWASELAAATVPYLPSTEPTQALARDEAQFNWVGAARALGRDGRAIPTQFAVIEEAAKRKFGVQLAQVTVLDGGRQWFPNHKGPEPASAPRHLTYCDIATKQDGIFIVPNSARDERFNANPYLEQTHMPFYAGMALRDREGEVIGSFCILDPIPRVKGHINKKKFLAFAQAAQDELWHIEDQVRHELTKKRA